MRKTHGAQFRSNSDEIKYYIREFLEDKKPHLRKATMAYVVKKTGNTTYTDEEWASSFQAVLETPGYESPRTGVYLYTGIWSEEDIASDVSATMLACKKILNQAIEEIKDQIQLADVVRKSALELTAEEFEEVEQLRNFVQQLEDIKL